MKTLLVSFIDSSNIGDRLIAETLNNLLLPTCETQKYSYKLIEESQVNVKQTVVRRSKLHEIYYKSLRSIPFVRQLVTKGKWLRGRRSMYDPKDIANFKEALSKSELLVIGGGNAIFDLSPATLSAQRFDQVVSLAKQHQVPIFVSSIGIGPFCTEKQEAAAIETLKKCEYVTFRDQRSFEYLVDAHHPAVYASVDPVFLLPAVLPFEQLEAEKRLKQRIGICVIDYRIAGCSHKTYLNYLEQMKELIQRLAQANREIILFSSEIQDYETLETIYADFQNHPQVTSSLIKDAEDLLELYKGLNLVIGTRMHSMIIAVSQYVPIIGLSWQQKVNEMFRNLCLEEDVLAIEELAQNMNQLLQKVQSKLANNSQEMKKMKECKAAMQEKFAINHQIIQTLERRFKE